MNTFRLATFTAAALTLAVVAGAQETAPGLLNQLEVRQLVERAEPAAHARLATHFGVLEVRYLTEAKRHVAMSRSFAGNPNRGLGGGMTVHCQRLADLNSQLAAAVKELATYHDTLAAGEAAPRPRDAAKLEAGAGAPAPTDHELNLLAAKARTPAEHGALQEYFDTLAKRYARAAKDHTAVALHYRGSRVAHVSGVHERLAGLANDAAKEAIAAADMHKGLATGAR